MDDDKDQYGRSPLVEALPALRAYNDLPVEERVKLARKHVEKQMLLRELERLLGE